MALVIAGAHVAVGPLLSTIYSIVQGISKLHQSYKFMHLTLSSISSTCGVTRASLGRLDSILGKNHNSIASFDEELFEGIKIAATMILSLLENHVADLLDAAANDMPLKAQETSRKNMLLALYNESDMKELLSQLKEQNALLNTVSNFVQSDNQEQLLNKQDKMMRMMETQDRTVQNMLRAQGTHRRYLEDADEAPISDTASIFTSATRRTALTAFEFDSVIKATAVYQRCKGRRDVKTSLISPRQSSGLNHRRSTKEKSFEVSEDFSGIPSNVPPTWRRSENTGLLAPRRSSGPNHRKGSREKGFRVSEDFSESPPIVPHPWRDPGTRSCSSTDHQSSSDELDTRWMPTTRRPGPPKTSSRDRTTHRFGIDHTSADHMYFMIQRQARKKNSERVQQDTSKEWLQGGNQVFREYAPQPEPEPESECESEPEPDLGPLYPYKNLRDFPGSSIKRTPRTSIGTSSRPLD